MVNRTRHYHLGCGENLQSVYVELMAIEKARVGTNAKPPAMHKQRPKPNRNSGPH